MIAAVLVPTLTSVRSRSTASAPTPIRASSSRALPGAARPHWSRKLPIDALPMTISAHGSRNPSPAMRRHRARSSGPGSSAGRPSGPSSSPSANRSARERLGVASPVRRAAGLAVDRERLARRQHRRRREVGAGGRPRGGSAGTGPASGRRPRGRRPGRLRGPGGLRARPGCVRQPCAATGANGWLRRDAASGVAAGSTAAVARRRASAAGRRAARAPARASGSGAGDLGAGSGVASGAIRVELSASRRNGGRAERRVVVQLDVVGRVVAVGRRARVGRRDLVIEGRRRDRRGHHERAGRRWRPRREACRSPSRRSGRGRAATRTRGRRPPSSPSITSQQNHRPFRSGPTGCHHRRAATNPPVGFRRIPRTSRLRRPPNGRRRLRRRLAARTSDERARTSGRSLRTARITPPSTIAASHSGTNSSSVSSAANRVRQPVRQRVDGPGPGERRRGERRAHHDEQEQRGPDPRHQPRQRTGGRRPDRPGERSAVSRPRSATARRVATPPTTSPIDPRDHDQAELADDLAGDADGERRSRRRPGGSARRT